MRFAPATGDKETRAKPVSAQAGELPRGQHDDEVDGLSGAYERLAEPTGATGSADLAELKRNNPHLFPPEWDVARFDATPPLVARRTGVFVPRFTPTRRTW